MATVEMRAAAEPPTSFAFGFFWANRGRGEMGRLYQIAGHDRHKSV